MEFFGKNGDLVAVDRDPGAFVSAKARDPVRCRRLPRRPTDDHEATTVIECVGQRCDASNPGATPDRLEQERRCPKHDRHQAGTSDTNLRRFDTVHPTPKASHDRDGWIQVVFTISTLQGALCTILLPTLPRIRPGPCMRTLPTTIMSASRRSASSSNKSAGLALRTVTETLSCSSS